MSRDHDFVSAHLSRSTAFTADFVDRVLTHGTLRLRCQRVTPLSFGSAERPYYEVLLAAADPRGVPLSTSRFIALAERYGRMPRVDRLVTALTFEWIRRNPGVMEGLEGLAINLSGQSMSAPGLARDLELSMRVAGVRPEQVLFEITETAPIEDLRTACRTVAALRALGCRVCVDDLGSGFADLRYVHQLGVDMVKFDGALIQHLAGENAGSYLGHTCVEQCLRRGIRIVAEQVEVASHAARLHALGFDFAQGFAIDRPRWIEEIEAHLGAARPGVPSWVEHASC